MVGSCRYGRINPRCAAGCTKPYSLEGMSRVRLAIISTQCPKNYTFAGLSSYLSPFTAKAKVGFTTTMLPPAKLDKANIRSDKTGI